MKKILATLLVATMLLSCMTFVSFAANYTVTTIANFPYADMAPGGAGDDLDEVGTYYYDYILDKYGVKEKNGDDITTEELFAALWSKYYDEADDVVLPTATKVGELVMLPILVENMGTVTVNIDWDPAFLTYAGFAGEYSAAVKGLDEVNGAVNFNGINMDAEDITGVWGAVFFTVNDAEGDADGLATTDVTYTVEEAKSCGGTNATVVNNKCTFALKGLKPGAPVVTKPSLADEATIAAIEDTFTAFVPSGALVEGLEGDAFAAVFGTFDAAAYAEKVVDYGFYYVAGSTELRNADKSVKTDDGKFGCIFYGTKWAIENGEAVFYVTYETAEGETVTVYAD